MENESADIPGAIAALYGALEAMEHTQSNLDAQLGDAKQHRREKLDRRVAALLPAISSGAMSRLKRSVPTFAADPKVANAFDQHRKVLWLFKPSGYNVALSLLQAQLKAFLEREGEAGNEDRRIQQLESQSALLATQQAEALDLLHLLEQTQRAQRADVLLSPEVVRVINSLAQRRQREKSREAYFRAPHGRAARFSGAQSSESDLDLWIWMFADIPTSFRTLLLNEVIPHHHDADSQVAPGEGNFGGAGASGTFDGDRPAPDTQGTEPRVVATDDRLGPFS